MKYLTITAILCLILAGASFAGNVTVTEVITGGNLTLTMPNNFSFPGRQLGGSATQNTSITNQSYYVEDSRGTGAGWNLGLQISQFVTSGTPQRSLSAADSTTVRIRDEEVSCVYGQGVNTSYGPKSLITSNTIIQNTELKAMTSLADYGMGKYQITPYYIVCIPASTYAGTYTATLTATLNNAP